MELVLDRLIDELILNRDPELKRDFSRKLSDERARADAAEAKASDEKARADAMAKALAGSIYREQTALGAPEETIVNKIAGATGSDIAAATRWMDEFAATDRQEGRLHGA